MKFRTIKRVFASMATCLTCAVFLLPNTAQAEFACTEMGAEEFTPYLTLRGTDTETDNIMHLSDNGNDCIADTSYASSTLIKIEQLYNYANSTYYKENATTTFYIFTWEQDDCEEGYKKWKPTSFPKNLLATLDVTHGDFNNCGYKDMGVMGTICNTATGELYGKSEWYPNGCSNEHTEGLRNLFNSTVCTSPEGTGTWDATNETQTMTTSFDFPIDLQPFIDYCASFTPTPPEPPAPTPSEWATTTWEITQQSTVKILMSTLGIIILAGLAIKLIGRAND